MNNQIHELSTRVLDQVSGGLKTFSSEPPSAPLVTTPPVWHGPVIVPTHNPFSAPNAGILER